MFDQITTKLDNFKNANSKLEALDVALEACGTGLDTALQDVEDLRAESDDIVLVNAFENLRFALCSETSLKDFESTRELLDEAEKYMEMVGIGIETDQGSEKQITKLLKMKKIEAVMEEVGSDSEGELGSWTIVGEKEAKRQAESWEADDAAKEEVEAMTSGDFLAHQIGGSGFLTFSDAEDAVLQLMCR